MTDHTNHDTSFLSFCVYMCTKFTLDFTTRIYSPTLTSNVLPFPLKNRLHCACIYIYIRTQYTSLHRHSHGKCAVYDRTALDITETPCDRFFKDGVDRFFVANDRHDGDVYRYVNYFDNPQIGLAFKILPQCPEEARRVLCQYFLPPCGNLTMFEPPKSICEDVCDYLLTLCPDAYRAVVDFFKSRPDLIELGFYIFSSCSNTGDFLDFPHCCSDLDIDIRKCTT